MDAYVNSRHLERQNCAWESKRPPTNIEFGTPGPQRLREDTFFHRWRPVVTKLTNSSAVVWNKIATPAPCDDNRHLENVLDATCDFSAVPLNIKKLRASHTVANMASVQCVLSISRCQKSPSGQWVCSKACK